MATGFLMANGLLIAKAMKRPGSKGMF